MFFTEIFLVVLKYLKLKFYMLVNVIFQTLKTIEKCFETIKKHHISKFDQ